MTITKIRDTKTRQPEKPEVKLAPKTETQQMNPDLCTVCTHAAYCIYKTKGKVVHHCDDYESIAGIESRMIVQPEPVRKDPEMLQGLCLNCLHKDDCCLKSQGGVWHCEEYEAG